MDNAKTHIENILIIDYNTIKFQSLGFIELVKQHGLESASLHSLDYFNYIKTIVNFNNRNTSELFDAPVSDEEYFDFIMNNYSKISELSPTTNLFSLGIITSGQKFISNIYLASYTKYAIDFNMANAIERLYFNIFDESEIEKYINERHITSVFLHDVNMLFKLVFNFRIPLDGMTFVISNLGYNYTMQNNDTLVKLYPEITEISEQFNFKVGYIDIYDESTLKEMCNNGYGQFT